jgi:hypothetical protein
MTERDHRTGSGGVKDNVRDELAEAAGYRKEAAPRKRSRLAPGGSSTLSGCANAPVGSVRQRRESA